MVTGGIPKDLDEESVRRIARSFYVVKMVRYAALLVSVLVVGALAAGRDAPGWVPWTMVGLALAFLAAMVLTRARYVSALRPPSGATASSPSPRG